MEQYEFDAAGRLAEVLFPDESYVRYASDPEGHRTAFTDELGRQTRYEYDPLGRLVAQVDALGYRTANASLAPGEISSSISLRCAGEPGAVDGPAGRGGGRVPI